MTQRVTCIIALLIALYGTAGYLIVFQVSREVFRSEMRAAIERNDPEEKVADFSFSKSYWKTIQTGDNEFMIDGKIYDIVSYKETKNSILVSAICDSNENNLLGLFSKTQSHSGGSGSLPEGLIDFLDSLMVADEGAENNPYFLADLAISSSIIFPGSSSYHLLIYSPPRFQ